MADLVKLQENLKKRGFAVSFFETSAEAAAYLADKVAGKKVGFGGSMTVKQMGLDAALTRVGATMFGHWVGSTHEEAAAAPVYISSVNGVAETGELINIDGTGNRVASTIYGHEALYLVFGVN